MLSVYLSVNACHSLFLYSKYDPIQNTITFSSPRGSLLGFPVDHARLGDQRDDAAASLLLSIILVIQFARRLLLVVENIEIAQHFWRGNGRFAANVGNLPVGHDDVEHVIDELEFHDTIVRRGRRERRRCVDFNEPRLEIVIDDDIWNRRQGRRRVEEKLGVSGCTVP